MRKKRIWTIEQKKGRQPFGADAFVTRSCVNPGAFAKPLHLLSYWEIDSPRKVSSQPWGQSQEWIKLERDAMEEKVFDQLKPTEPVQKLLPHMDKEALQEALKREGWWKAWAKVRRPS